MAGLSKSRLERMHHVLSGYVERQEMPGLVALVSHHDDVHVETLGTMSFGHPAPMKRDTIFRIASITKPITAFVWRMEDILEVYTRAYDPRYPQICMDESAKQLLKDKRESLPVQPGQPERVDYTFEAAGMCKLFLACEPLAGKRFVKVTERRTSQDWAHFIRELVDVHYPTAEKLVLVMDNLNTHTPSSLYSTFAPPEALRILKKLEIHYTPVHGSWLNMAEIELSALARQCLSRRMGTQGELEREVQAWQQRHNEEAITVNWRFTTADARIKLKRLYPSLEPRKRPSKKIDVAKKA